MIFDCLGRLFEEVPDSWLKDTATPASNNIFEGNRPSMPLLSTEAKIFYHRTMQLLYLCKCVWPDVQLPIVYLTTRVQNPTCADYKKLQKTVKYLYMNRHLPRTRESKNLSVIKCYIDALFAVRDNIRSHTGGIMTMNKGCVYGASLRQRLNNKSSTEARIVWVSDLLPQIVWTR